jgi:hypothetical protein
VDTWRTPDSDGTRGEVSAAAAVLRNAGWRVAIVRHGDSTPQSWQVLLAGFETSARTTAALR